MGRVLGPEVPPVGIDGTMPLPPVELGPPEGAERETGREEPAWPECWAKRGWTDC